MTKWATNSEEVLATIPLTDRATIEDIQFNLEQREQSPVSKPTMVIGMTWKPAEDSFTLESYKQRVDRNESTTYCKRGISSSAPNIYDINGQICPFILRGKLTLQQCWTLKTKGEEIRPWRCHEMKAFHQILKKHLKSGSKIFRKYRSSQTQDTFLKSKSVEPTDRKSRVPCKQKIWRFFPFSTAPISESLE